MKRFFLSVALCASLLGLLSLVIVRSSRAKEDVIQTLLDLPAPPPPNPLSPPLPGTRPEKFYDKAHPPADDAPIEDILAYWKRHNAQAGGFGFRPTPSDKVIDRLIDEIDKDPKLIGEYVNLFSRSKRGIEFAKHIYDQMPEDEDERDEEGGLLRDSLRTWLTNNSPYFSEDLSHRASALHDDGQGYVAGYNEILSLTRVDWERAKGIVNNAYGDASQPIAQTASKWALYRHALEEDSIGDIDRFRQELMDTVENRELTVGQRDLALDALLTEKEWTGRNDWYFSLFSDETLLDMGRFTGLTTMMLWAPDDRYIPKLIELTRSENITVRSAAARNLTVAISADKPEVVRALLPWLQDAKWAKDIQGSRVKVVQALQNVKIPQSVPALLTVLDEREIQKVPDYGAYANTNAAWSNVNRAVANAVNAANIAARAASGDINGIKMQEVTVYPFRSAAITALGTQGDSRAVPALKRVFNQVEAYEKAGVVQAIFKCNGFSIGEQVHALEDFVRDSAAEQKFVEYQKQIAPPGSPYSNVNALPNLYPTGYVRTSNANISTLPIYGDESRTDLNFLLGAQLAVTRDVSEELASAAVKRVDALEKTEPDTADFFRRVITNWRAKAINVFLLNDVKTGKENAGTIVRLLTMRRELREKQRGDISDIRSGVPEAAGFAACLLESEGDYAAVLAGRSDDARKALFACGRLIRAKLPVQTVTQYLKNPDKQLALAAEKYLESEDSSEARKAVLALHPNEAKILGATTSFHGTGDLSGDVTLMQELFASVIPNFGPFAEYSEYPFTVAQFDDEEKRLQKEMLSTPDLVGIFTYDSAYVRIYKEKAVLSVEEDNSRYRERPLEKEEFENLKSYLAASHADELPPFLSCENYCEPTQVLMIGRSGGRRVFDRSTRKPDFFVGLDRIIDGFKKTPGKLKYWLEKDVPGLEIVYADATDRYGAEAVWKSGTDIRVLIADEVRRKQIEREVEKAEEAAEGPGSDALNALEKRKFEHYSWRRVANGALGETADQPPDVPFLPPPNETNFNIESWKARSAGVELRAREDGLYKMTGARTNKIATGSFSSPVISSTGRWAVATRYIESGDGSQLVRMNLLTGRVSPVVDEEVRYMSPIAYVASVNRFLIGFRGSDEYEGEGPPPYDDGGGTYVWLVPETGQLIPVTREVRPIAQQRYRPLQAVASAPFEYWTAIPNGEGGETLFGIYNTRTFQLRPLLKLPRIQFNSEALWVDDAASRVYFVYNAHVLSAPFKR